MEKFVIHSFVVFEQLLDLFFIFGIIRSHRLCYSIPFHHNLLYLKTIFTKYIEISVIVFKRAYIPY